MKRDTTLFAEDLKVDVSGEEVPYDTSHIYTGELYGETVPVVVWTRAHVALTFSVETALGGVFCTNIQKTVVQ